MVKKDVMVKIPKTPKPPWRNYDPLSREVYGETFDVSLPTAPVEVEGTTPGPEDAPIEEGVRTTPDEDIPEIMESSVEEVPVFEEIPVEENPSPVDEVTPIEDPETVAHNTPKKVVRRRKAVPATEEDAVMEAAGDNTKRKVIRRRKAMPAPDGDVVMEPTSVNTRRRVVRRKKAVE